MALANESPLDGASSKFIPPRVKILEGPKPSLGFLFGAFSCCFAHAPSVLGLVQLHLWVSWSSLSMDDKGHYTEKIMIFSCTLSTQHRHTTKPHNEVSAPRAWYLHCRIWPCLGGGCEPRTTIYSNVYFRLLRQPASFWYHNDCREIQGTTKRLRPGLVDKRRKNCVWLPAAARRTQFFHPIFTEPRAHHKVHSCICESVRLRFI